MKTKFLVLTNGRNIGDDNNAIAIAERTLSKVMGGNSYDPLLIERVNTVNQDIEAVVRKINEEQVERVFIIGAGEHQLKHYEALRSIKAVTTAVWLSHQPCKSMETAFNHIDYFALPKALFDAATFAAVSLDYDLFQAKGKLLPVELIPHDKTPAGIRDAYQKWPEKFTHDKNIICILGGDAPLPGGKEFNFFTVEEAKRLADRIAEKALQEGRFVYVTNGPRTGQFDHNSGKKVESAHKENSPADAVTQAFIERLHSHKAEYQLFDFKFLDKGGVRSALAPLYHHALITDSFLYLPGETISGISEVITLELGERMEIYPTGSMNQNHHQFIENLKGKSLARIPNPVDEVVDFFLTNPYIQQDLSRLKAIIASATKPTDPLASTALGSGVQSTELSVDLAGIETKVLSNIPVQKLKDRGVIG